jgi:hypothetical protein
MQGYHLDPEGGVAQEHYAVIYAPRRERGRFAEECVEVMASEAEALAAAEPAKKRFAAKVIGPARSSEGFRLYYLVCWLEE